jgi:hypothetical protein
VQSKEKGKTRLKEQGEEGKQEQIDTVTKGRDYVAFECIIPFIHALHKHSQFHLQFLQSTQTL